MKKIFYLLLAVSVTLVSYGQNKKDFVILELPCTIYDTDDYLTATGIAYGLKDSIASLKTQALINAQTEIHLKMSHVYKGLVESYSIQSNDSEPKSKIEIAGSSFMELQVGESEVVCLKFSDIDKDGKISCFIAIRVKKQRQIEKKEIN